MTSPPSRAGRSPALSRRVLRACCGSRAIRLQKLCSREDRSGTAGRVVRPVGQELLPLLPGQALPGDLARPGEPVRRIHVPYPPRAGVGDHDDAAAVRVNEAAAFRPATGPGTASPMVDRVRTSHNRTLPAASAPTAVLPSGARSTVSAKPPRPVSGPPSGFPVAMSHRRTAPVWPPVIRVRPSLETSAVNTPAASACTVLTIRCAAVSQITKYPPSPHPVETTSCEPSGVKSSSSTVPGVRNLLAGWFGFAGLQT